MARTRRKRLTPLQLAYLAGLAQTNLFFQSAGENPVSIDKKPERIEGLVAVYGGETRKVPDQKWYGWYLPLEDRLAYWKQIYPEYTLPFEQYKGEKIIQRLENAIENGPRTSSKTLREQIRQETEEAEARMEKRRRAAARKAARERRERDYDKPFG